MNSSDDQIKCARIERGKFHPVIAGYEKVNASSTGPRQWKELSPFLLGPVVIKTNGADLFSYRFENYWQGCKVYNVDMLGEDKINMKQFYKRRAGMLALAKGKRRALPKSKAFPVSSLYWLEGEERLMGYVESRKKIYCPMYADLARKTKAYADLYKLVKSGKKVLIVGPDGRDIKITPASLLEALEDPTNIFGHELVLCCLLIGYQPWLSEEIQSGPIEPLV